MESILIGGAPSVGKSGVIVRLANRLTLIGFVVIAGSIPITFKDFNAVLEGRDNKGRNIKIIINSPTDTVGIIKYFKRFFDENGKYDILISSIRDDDFWPRKDFFRIMGLSGEKNVLEIPLGKITRRGGNFSVALNWYEEKIDKLLVHILNNPPYNI